MSSWTVMIFGACTRHAYKPLFENLPAWRLRGGKFRVFSAFFGENHWNRRRSRVKLRRERTPPCRPPSSEVRRRPRRVPRWPTFRGRVGRRVGCWSRLPRCPLPQAGGAGWPAEGPGPGPAAARAHRRGAGAWVASAVRRVRLREGVVKCGRTPDVCWGSST